MRPLAEDVPPITVGAAAAPVSHLTCMDWGASAIKDGGDKYPPWNQNYVRTLAKGGTLKHNITPFGAWNLHFARSGMYRITLRTLPAEAPLGDAQLSAGTATLLLGSKTLTRHIPAGARDIQFKTTVAQGTTTLETLIESHDNSVPAHGAFFMNIEYLNTR